jgi:Cu-Zn family superoxide dismutase
MTTTTTTTTTMLALIVGAALAASGGALAEDATAVAKLEPRSGSKVTGTATFTERAGRVTMKIVVKGLKPGTHAIHLHELGDCSAPDASSAGGHWNPTGEKHGRWGHAPFHHGDIGNLAANKKGEAELTFDSDLWTIDGGKPADIVGRSVVIHAKQDDFATQPTGNAGKRVACGVIEKTP